MKKKLAVFIAVTAVLTASMCAVGTGIIYKAQQEEMRRIENVAGAVISAYPEAEELLVSAAVEETMEHEKSGAEIMSHYGYDGDMELGERYGRLMIEYFILCIAIMVLSTGSGIAVFLYIMKKHRLQEEKILSMLDQCLSGSYGFAYDEEKLAGLENPLFADSIVKLAQSLKLKNDRLDEERDSTKTLVTDISHQLKTPIAALRVCLDMYEEAESPEEKKEFFDRTMIQMEKLESLTADLVNISRLENSMITLDCRPVMMSEILVYAVNSVYHKARAKDIAVETEDFDDIGMELDIKWTGEALFNILDNAVKYSPAGSKVRITVSRLFSFIRVEIADEGIGIPPQERNKIFRRFYRGSDDDVRSQEGAGVGLYLCRSIIELQGGTVSVKQARTGGSIFVVQLPLP